MIGPDPELDQALAAWRARELPNPFPALRSRASWAPPWGPACRRALTAVCEGTLWRRYLPPDGTARAPRAG